MRQEIVNNLDQPKQLEQLYRSNKAAFAAAFHSLYPQIQDHFAAQFWQERLSEDPETVSFGNRQDWKFVLIATFLAGCVTKLPDWLHLNTEQFFQRNVTFIIFPFLSAWFYWKNRFSLQKLIFPIAAIAAAAIYINLLPVRASSDSIVLACIHLPLLLWVIFSYVYAGGQFVSPQKQIQFVRYNGDLVVMINIMAIAAMIFTAIIINLFRLIDIDISQFYTHYVAVWGGAAIPLVGNYLVQTNPQLVHKVSPVIARVFTPVVLVSLLFYLVGMLYTVKNPYQDRDFLVIFNAMLVGVMALILFSLAAMGQNTAKQVNLLILFALSLLTLVVNGIVLSAILYRVMQFGVTPNRLAVAGGDILIFIHLARVSAQLFLAIRKKSSIAEVEQIMVSYLPLYGLWAAGVFFIFPWAFQFR